MKLAIAVVCLALAAPGSAVAATAALTYEDPVPGVDTRGAYSLDVRGGAAEVNDILVFGDDGGYTVRDTAASLFAGPGCESVGAHEVRCPTEARTPNRSVLVDGGAMDDRLSAGAVPGIGILPGPSTVELRGGGGDDEILGGAAHELLLGGRGADRVAGGDGFDRLDGGDGDDVLDGGRAQDRLSYQSRTRPVTVDLAAGSGGVAGERDELRAIEDVDGGRAADRIAGDRNANILVGGEGDARDLIEGRGGDDTLTGFHVRGGPGRDTLDGRRMACGSGRDTLYRGIFRTRGPFPAACEVVQAVFVLLTSRPLSTSSRRAAFGVRCRASQCRGRLELHDSRGRLGSTRFSLRNRGATGAMRRVGIPLARRSAERVATLRVRGVSAFHRDQFRTRVR